MSHIQLIDLGECLYGECPLIFIWTVIARRLLFFFANITRYCISIKPVHENVLSLAPATMHTYVGKIRDLLARRKTLLGSATAIVYVDERKLKEDNKHRNYDNPNGSFGIHVGCKLET